MISQEIISSSTEWAFALLTKNKSAIGGHYLSLPCQQDKTSTPGGAGCIIT